MDTDEHGFFTGGSRESGENKGFLHEFHELARIFLPQIHADGRRLRIEHKGFGWISRRFS
jgi:hypothetical protein